MKPYVKISYLIARSATSQVELYRNATRKASGIVTGFIAETYGSVQAVKVATAEEPVVEHFRTLNEKRRVVALKDSWAKQQKK